MKTALFQMDILPNRIDKNLSNMLEQISIAKKNDCDIICFPELCLSGYMVGDLFSDDSYCRELMLCNDIIRDESDGIVIAYGNIFFDEFIDKRCPGGYHPNKDGRLRRYNAAYVYHNKNAVNKIKEIPQIPVGIQIKTLLPDYRYFHESRYFFSVQDIADEFSLDIADIYSPFLLNMPGGLVKAGFELCEDLWCKDYRFKENALNPSGFLINNGAEIIFNLSASPFTIGKNNARDRRIKFLKEECSSGFVPFVYLNCVGAQNNGKNILSFDGGSTVYNKNAAVVLRATESYKEELIFWDGSAVIAVEKTHRPDIEEKYFAIINGLRHLKNMTGSETEPAFVIGLSGGIDSSLVAVLLTIAFGKNNVLGINMPTRYNSDLTKNCAKKLSENLGIDYVEIPIENMVSQNASLVEISGEKYGIKLSNFNLENIQAKIRGASILSNCAAMFNRLFTNNGNKLETALGYATLYGDVSGAISPIGDLIKTEVYEMSRFINESVFKNEVIPGNLFPDNNFNFSEGSIIPSAELKENQIDPMKFGYHCAVLTVYTNFNKASIVDICRWYLERTLEKNLNISKDLILRWEIDKPKIFIEDIEWFDKKFRQNVFKRVQSPPVIITSKSAFGYDIRESILPYYEMKQYKILKNEILGISNYYE